jgi:hypothetical protein
VLSEHPGLTLYLCYWQLFEARRNHYLAKHKSAGSYVLEVPPNIPKILHGEFYVEAIRRKREVTPPEGINIDLCMRNLSLLEEFGDL